MNSIFTQRTTATPATVGRELDAHILAQAKAEGLGHMGTTVEGAIHNDLGEKVGTYRGHVNSYGRLVSVSTFPGQGIR